MEAADDSRRSAGKNHNKYRRDKPWDNEEIDHWKLEVCFTQHV